jgi:hypothetical protein
MNEICMPVLYRCANVISSGGTEKLHQYKGAKMLTVMLMLEYAFARVEVIQLRELSISCSSHSTVL